MADVAFAGDGEPTTPPEFPAAARAAREARDRLAPGVPLRLLTNATLLHKDRVRAALAEFDELWCKLDAGTEAYFHVVDGTRLPFRRILDNLLLVARERPIVVQSLFLALDGVGPDDAEIAAWVERLREIVGAGRAHRPRAGLHGRPRAVGPALRAARPPRGSRRSPPPPGPPASPPPSTPDRRFPWPRWTSAQRLDTLFPRIEDVPAAADFAPGGGVYPDGTLYLVDGEVRRWTGATSEVTSPVCVVRDGRVERRRMGAARRAHEGGGARRARRRRPRLGPRPRPLADDERRRAHRRRRRPSSRAWRRSARSRCAC